MVIVDSTNEEWRPVSGYEDRYDVSSLGRVKSKFKTSPAKILKGCKDKKGYLAAALTKNGDTKWKFIHCLVLEAFVGPRPDGYEACHGNGTPSDNRLCNLRWGTRVENAADVDLHGRRHRPTGSRNPKAKLSERDVRVIRIKLRDGTRPVDIATEYGVNYSTIKRLRSGKSWAHI